MWRLILIPHVSSAWGWDCLKVCGSNCWLNWPSACWNSDSHLVRHYFKNWSFCYLFLPCILFLFLLFFFLVLDSTSAPFHILALHLSLRPFSQPPALCRWNLMLLAQLYCLAFTFCPGLLWGHCIWMPTELPLHSCICLLKVKGS